MFPWEHAIVGYLAYSLACHAYYRESPGALEAVAVAVASVLPDAIDKPLSWEFGIFPGGYGLGHSLLVAVPLALVVGLLARSLSRPRVGVAFGVGYLLHPPGDVVDHVVREGLLQYELLLWPVRTAGSTAVEGRFLENAVYYLERYRAQLVAGELSTYARVQLGLGVVVALVWLYDGAPVLRECGIGGRRLVRRALSASEESQ